MRGDPLTSVLGATVHGVDLSHVSDDEVACGPWPIDSGRASGTRSKTSSSRTAPACCGSSAPGTQRVFGGGRHSDFTWSPIRPYCSFLHGQIVPPIGGDTCFVSTIATFASLTPTMQSLLRGLSAVHRYHDYDGHEQARFEATHPVVLAHPVTGAEGLFVNSMFVTHFAGMTAADR